MPLKSRSYHQPMEIAMHGYEVRFPVKATAVPVGLEATVREEIDRIESDGLEKLSDLWFHTVFDATGREWICVPIENGTVLIVGPTEWSSTGEYLGKLE